MSLFDLSLQLFVCKGVGWLELIGIQKNLYWLGLAATWRLTKLDLVEGRYDVVFFVCLLLLRCVRKALVLRN